MVARIEGGFRNAPGRAETATVVHLLLHHQIVGLVENASLALLHDERRHQVFEHRAGPGDQRAARADRHDRTAELVPMFGRKVALGNGEQARQTCFGGEQVVAGLVEFVGLDAVADRQQAALRPEQEAEIH